MAENKVLKGINFPGLEGTYYVPEAIAVEDENGYVEIKSYVSDTVEVENLDTTLTKSGMAADAAEVGKILNQKVDKVDGEAQCLTVEDSLTIKLGSQAEGAYFYTYVDDHNYPTVELLGTANDDFVKLYGIANPTQSNDAVNKQYVDTNFAPAGYGLGEVAPSSLIQTTAALDAAKATGWYRFYGYESGSYWNIGGYISGLIEVKGSRTATDGIRQYFYPDGCNAYLVRMMADGAWSKWEWVNPPMIAGQEYRTTERWNGKPVYTKAYSIGSLPDTSYVEISYKIANLDRVISCVGSTNSNMVLPNISSSSTSAVNLITGGDCFRITTAANRSNLTAVVVLKYTKTTD